MVREVKFDLPNLPASYNGMKIAVISDVHLDNFTGAHSFLDSVKHDINSNQVEIICLTGDLLNMVGREGEEYFPYFIDMNAKIGKYAIMGNHDYGDYSSWPSSDAKYENLLLAHSTYRHLGFDLLLDEFRILRNSEDSISIIGVENWSKPPFPQYGSFEKATENIPVLPFNILLTHDPNHWEYEIMGKQKIDLTLSGHTHGAQIAFNRCGIKWSPASVLFKNWDGVYQHNNQFLFVNQGLGYVGLPYRLGTPPEITIITLNHSETFGYDINVSRSHLWSRDKVIYSCN